MNIGTWRKELSQIEEFLGGHMALKQRDKKYRLEEMDTMYVSALLRLKIREGGIKIKRNDDRCQQFEQSQLF